MITHKNTIIQVTFTVDGRLYKNYSLQSSDWAFIKSTNPYGYKFVDVNNVIDFLDEQKELIQKGWANNGLYEWSYLKFFVLGNERGKHTFGIWNGKRATGKPEYEMNIPYESIKIEKVIALDKSTDKKYDITEQFMRIWNLGNK